MPKPNGVESSLLKDWVGWDHFGIACLDFHKAKLKISIGPYNAGDVVDYVLFDFEKMEIQIEGKHGKYTCRIKPLEFIQ